MIELTVTTVTSAEIIVEFRNKLLSLLTDLNFPAMERIRITIQISELMHSVFFHEKSSQIKLAIDKPDQVLWIIFNIVETPLSSLKTNVSLAQELIPNESQKGGEIRIKLHIDDSIILDEKVIHELKEKIIIQSKNSLLREIKHKNEELHHLLEDLKKSSSLIQSEKMSALGVLTAGVAHELNNPMMGILNFVQYAIKNTDQNNKIYNVLIDAEHETKRCIDIVSNLLTFSHLEQEGETVNLKEVQPSVLIERILKILSYRLRSENILVKKEYPTEIRSILCYENRLQQAILNLITNAMDAMKTVKNKILGIKIYYSDAQVKITISDTGIGMDNEVKKKIFDPFFTTKPTGSGTGLGLSVCESIVKAHNGNIICISEKNKGTSFAIILPFLRNESNE